jgi:S-adenosylmethionine-diacylglycerol 3-amino-3-carboxypropyl transferase
MSDQLAKVDFDIIRYANLWEDADVLLEGLDLDSNSKVMSIASAGDNCFSMLTKGVEKVVAVDVSKVQLYLVELKKAAITAFNREDYMAFIGFKPSINRPSLFLSIAPELSDDCKNYWIHHSKSIEEGVIHTGKFERYFQLFKEKYLHDIHPQAAVDELFRSKGIEEQKEFHDVVWHNEAWKKMYRFFFGEQMMGEHGRDPEFLKHVKGNVSDLILAKEVDAIRKPSIQNNYFLYYILNNKFIETYLPHYVRQENYDKVKANLSALVLHEGLLDSALEVHQDCTHFNLSDIFEYMDTDLFRSVSKGIIEKSAPKAKIAYWNLMIPRFISVQFPNKVAYLKELSERLKEKDMGYFYQSFIIDQKK